MGVFKMPSLGADMEVGTLVDWLVQPGDKVNRGDVVAVVETQKGAIDIETFEEGTVHSLVAEIGQELPVGAPLAVILAEGETAPTHAEQPQPEPPMMPEPAAPPEPDMAAGAPAAAPRMVTPPPGQPATQAGDRAVSPAARVRAKELGIELSAIHGSGPNGAVVLADIEPPAPAPATQSSAPPRRIESPREEMRKAIAAAMARSKQTIPHFYLSHTIDIQATTDWLADHNKGASPADRMIMSALFVRASALAAEKVPVLNGRYLEDGFHPADTVNPGVAIALRGGGLVAPALMNATSMTLQETMDGIRDLVSRARAGRLKSSELTQGTLTVSALGESGPESMTGVIFPPQVALIGLGAPQIRPWIHEGAVVPRTTITVVVSADHRVADGRQAAKFIASFESLIQNPESL